MLMVHFPKAALPLRSERLDQLLARALPADSGMNAIVARYLANVVAALRQGELGEREAGRLGQVALDLVATALAAQIDAEDRLTHETRRQALLYRIEAFIEHNLNDPDLNPAMIAGHHHISQGYLHSLFQARDLTVTAWIRRLRLERCCADLADPRLRHHPVHAIGARWGLRDAAHFSRAFRAVHGMTPADYRRQAQAGSAGDAREVERASRNP
jgi:AraC-like DNA-binding protein